MSKTKKYILWGVGIFILLALIPNCGGNDEAEVQEKKELILKVDQRKIKGDLKECFKVVDKDYRVKFAKKSYENDVITVELERTSNPLPHSREDLVIFPEAENSSANYCAGFGIEILDANGDVIDKKNPQATPYSWDEMTAALQLLPDETTTIQFHFDNLSDAVSFRVTSIVTKNEERKSSAKASAKSSVNTLIEAAEEAIEDNDYDADLEDAEKALEAAGKAVEATGKMLDALNSMW